MDTSVILVRGINGGGKSKIPMPKLKCCLEEQGFENVVTYIQSGNVVLRSKLTAKNLSETIEILLVRSFKLDSALALDYGAYKEIVTHAPDDFGKDNVNCRYDVAPNVPFAAPSSTRVPSSSQNQPCYPTARTTCGAPNVLRA